MAIQRAGSKKAQLEDGRQGAYLDTLAVENELIDDSDESANSCYSMPAAIAPSRSISEPFEDDDSTYTMCVHKVSFLSKGLDLKVIIE